MSASTLRHRPIFGGVFGKGRYSLASLPCIAKGLHSVRYMVIDPSAGAVLSVAEDKLEALATARKVLKAADAFAEPRTCRLVSRRRSGLKRTYLPSTLRVRSQRQSPRGVARSSTSLTVVATTAVLR